MARSYERNERVADEMHRLLAELIQRELRDPQVGMVSITRLSVSRDLAHAKIHFTDMRGDPTPQQAEALNRAAGFLRSRLAGTMRTRTVPALHFSIDEAYLKGEQVKSLLNKMDFTEDDDDDEQES